MVLHYRADDKKKFNATISLATQRDADLVSVGPQKLTLVSELGNGIRCQVQAVVTSQGGDQISGADHIALRAVDSFTVVIAIETNYLLDYGKRWRGDDPEIRISERLKKVRGQVIR